MNVQFALNYSRKAAALLRAGEIRIDLFKCPAWPDLVAESQALCATYVHFPLRVGAGDGDALNEETKRRAEWRQVENLLKRTGTPFINLHLAPEPHEHPGIPIDATGPQHVERICDALVRDVEAVVTRFGAERVMVENCHPSIGTILHAACLPEVIGRVVSETGCGLLLDLSHARLAAGAFALDAHAYIEALPVGRINEVHVTGLQRLDERWLSVVRAAGVDDAVLGPYAGHMMDHLPMTAPDWEFLQWALAQISVGTWRIPWVITCEYGGVGGAWEAVTFTDVLRSQVPHMYNMVHS
jgi:uncharacterized protein (UPF0276 family)